MRTSKLEWFKQRFNSIAATSLFFFDKITIFATRRISGHIEDFMPLKNEDIEQFLHLPIPQTSSFVISCRISENEHKILKIANCIALAHAHHANVTRFTTGSTVFRVG
jgi:hypothetical protein